VSSVAQDLQLDGVPLVRLESPELEVDVAPSVGGRIVRVVDKATGYDFLWRNSNLKLERKTTGSEYDPNFYGGIDELLPNDLTESIDGIECPDHGELWTTSLNPALASDRLTLKGHLPGMGLEYQREMCLRANSHWIDFNYRIRNSTAQQRRFLWKLHAAVGVQEGDVIECPAGRAQVVDPAWSRFKSTAPFVWPELEGKRTDVVPARDGTMDFFYLFELSRGEMFWRRPSMGLKFGYQFDTKTFPYAWLFGSWGGFLEHYTVILEPCTTMPMSLQMAAAKNQCSCLEPGQVLETKVSLYAGPE
jgi:hypothetical protein